MKNKLRTLTLELIITQEDDSETTEEYIIRELPTHWKLKMYNWDKLPEDAFYGIVASCVIDSEGNQRFTEEEVMNIEPDVVSHLVAEIQDLSKDRKIVVSKKKN